MDLTLKNISLLIAIVLTGLSAGLFYAWSVSVIPGTKKVIDSSYLEVMQQINREIMNPQFFLVFIGSMVLLAFSAVLHYGSGVSFWLLLVATGAYILGTFVVTGLGNVPLNNELDGLKLGQLNPSQMQEFRRYYEARWNLFHQIRTFFSVLAFIASLIAAFTANSFTTH